MYECCKCYGCFVDINLRNVEIPLKVTGTLFQSIISSQNALRRQLEMHFSITANPHKILTALKCFTYLSLWFGHTVYAVTRLLSELCDVLQPVEIYGLFQKKYCWIYKYLVPSYLKPMRKYLKVKPSDMAYHIVRVHTIRCTQHQ